MTNVPARCSKCCALQWTSPTSEAIVEISGERINYRELWDRSAHLAGGLKNLGVARGDRVAIRLGNGLDWCIAFWGTLMSGAVVVPVNTRFAEPEVEYVINDSGSRFVFLPGQPLPSGDPFAVEDLCPHRLGRHFLHQRNHRFPKGRHDHAREFSLEYRNGRRSRQCAQTVACGL